MTEDQLVDDVFAKEGDKYGDLSTKPPIDQPTARGGITLGTLAEFVEATGSELKATAATLKTMTRGVAEDIVRWKLRRIASDNKFDQIVFEPLRLQMIDFSYNSGPSLAIRWLQRVFRVPRTGKMDTATLIAYQNNDPWLVNQALVGARLQMIDMWTDASKQAKAWEEGVESRGLAFSLLEVP